MVRSFWGLWGSSCCQGRGELSPRLLSKWISCGSCGQLVTAGHFLIGINADDPSPAQCLELGSALCQRNWNKALLCQFLLGNLPWNFCHCLCVCVKARGETCFSHVWELWLNQDWAKVIWPLSFPGLEKIRGAGDGLVAAGGVRMVQRSTVSAALLQNLCLLCCFKGKVQYHRSYSSAGLLVSQSTGTSQHSAPVCLQSWGHEEVTKASLGFECFSTLANQPYFFFTLCCGPTASQGASCWANCKRQLTNLSWQSHAF